MRGTVITYHEASTKKTNATDNIILKTKKKTEKGLLRTVALNSSEFPMRTLGGCLWPPTGPGATKS